MNSKRENALQSICFNCFVLTLLARFIANGFICQKNYFDFLKCVKCQTFDGFCNRPFDEHRLSETPLFTHTSFSVLLLYDEDSVCFSVGEGCCVSVCSSGGTLFPI